MPTLVEEVTPACQYYMLHPFIKTGLKYSSVCVDLSVHWLLCNLQILCKHCDILLYYHNVHEFWIHLMSY
jgi:hypothetical protein